MPPTATIRLLAHLDLAAASGIARHADRLYVIADDALELAVYDLEGARTETIPLLPGELPKQHTARKAAKPDFETLLSLPDGSLLALGSGSTERRQRGALVQLTASGADVIPIELGMLYHALQSELPELNIEGGAVFGSALYLCSRGNGARRDNALVQLDLARALEALARARGLTADCLRGLKHVQLGELEGIALSLTDLTVHEHSLMFCAAAEASANTYDDGVCAGSVIGRLSPDGLVSGLVTLPERVKLEGICSAGPEALYAVADADDPNARAPLFLIELPRETS